MVTNSNDNLLRLASLMIAEIEGFFTSMHVGLRHPVSEFSFESGRNAFYVVYAGNGMPLKAGVMLGSHSAEERSRIVTEIETLAGLGYAATYRALDLGSELLAHQIGRILLDLFGATLPLSGARIAESVAASSAPRAAVAPYQAMPVETYPAAPDASNDETTEPAAEHAQTPVALPVGLPAGLPEGLVPGEGFVLPKRKRGRPRKEEVLARQALLAAQAQAESDYPMPFVIPSPESAPRRRGRPRKVDAAQTPEQVQADAVVAAAMESLFGNGAGRHVNGDHANGDHANGANGESVNEDAVSGTAHVEATEPVAVETPTPRNGNGYTNGAHAAEADQPVVAEETEEEQENGGRGLDQGFPGSSFNGGLPLTKNQRREMRRRELERIRRESGLSN